MMLPEISCVFPIGEASSNLARAGDVWRHFACAGDGPPDGQRSERKVSLLQTSGHLYLRGFA